MQVIFSGRSKKSLVKIPAAYVSKILSVIDDLQSWPALSKNTDIVKLRGEDSAFRIRFGSYRIIFSCKNDTIEVLDILHRKDAYKK